MKTAPIFFKNEELGQFLKNHPNVKKIDNRELMFSELAEIRNPSLRTRPRELKGEVKKFVKWAQKNIAGNWVYFPWKEKLIWYLPEGLHNELRTVRNKHLIKGGLGGEQEKFYNFPIGIAGLSVGSHAATTIAMMGGCQCMNLADSDIISASNLNRIRYGFDTVGAKKADVVAQSVYEMNPYARLKLFSNGITKNNFKNFLYTGSPSTGKTLGSPKRRIKLLIEEMDDLAMKIRVRMFAKKHRLPVLMVTQNVYGVIADVERYDLDPNLKIFGGRVKLEEIIALERRGLLTAEKKAEIATKIVNPKDVHPSMLASIKEVGKTLYSWPQLGLSATMVGVVLAYMVFQFATGKPLKTQRVRFSFEKLFKYEI